MIPTPRRRRVASRPLALAILFSALVVFSACGTPEWDEVLGRLESRYPDVERVSTDGLERMLSDGSGPAPVLLDVRAPEEYEVSHLPGAVLAPDEDAALEALRDAEPDTPVVVYCAIGYRSSALAQRLQARGFTRVRNLEGSIFAWANEGRPVYRGDQRVDRVHPYDAHWGSLLDERLRHDPGGQERRP